MKRLFLFICVLLGATTLSAQTIDYKGTEVTLGPRALFVDGSLSAAEAAKSPYIFNSFTEAMGSLQNGTRAAPMRV